MDQISSLITLTFSDARPALTTLPEINAALTRYGARLWPIDLAAIPVRVVALLRQETLTVAECSAVLDHFLLPRGQLLSLIGEAGRKPQVAGGGEMETFEASNRVRYPQLYLVGAGIDYFSLDGQVIHAGKGRSLVPTGWPKLLVQAICKDGRTDRKGQIEREGMKNGGRIGSSLILRV